MACYIMLKSTTERTRPDGAEMHAVKDDKYLFALGQEAAARMGIPNFVGLQIAAGRRYLQPVRGTAWVHVVVWMEGQPGSYQARKLNGKWVTDLDKLTQGSPLLHALSSSMKLSVRTTWLQDCSR